MSRKILSGTLLCLLYLAMIPQRGSAQTDVIHIKAFKSPEQGQKLRAKFRYALASAQRGVPLESLQILEDMLPKVSYDRRLFGYTRIAVTYLQLGKVEKAKVLLMRIITAVQGNTKSIGSRLDLAIAYLDAGSFERAAAMLEEVAQSCGPDRQGILQQVNVARATLAVQQHQEARIALNRVQELLALENQEHLDSFDFSLDGQMFDSLAGADAH